MLSPRQQTSNTSLQPTSTMFNANKLKVNLKLSINRLKLLQAKKTSINNQTRRDVAGLLERGKEESARIRVEHIIREDFNVEALEIIELYCEMLLARFGLVETMKHCDPAISEAVNTIIYAAPRSAEVKELNAVREQLISKYGREFAIAAMENTNDVVNARIIQKLKIQTPDPILVTEYLKAISSAYKISWEPSEQTTQLLNHVEGTLLNPSSSSQQQHRPSTVTLPPSYEPTNGLHAPQNDKSTPSGSIAFPEPPASLPTFPSAPPTNPQGPGQSDVPDFDELAKRFDALKKRRT